MKISLGFDGTSVGDAVVADLNQEGFPPPCKRRQPGVKDFNRMVFL
jgi:hypothetical protein